MKSRSRIDTHANYPLCLAAAAMLVLLTATSVWSAPAMSQELKTTIMNRIPVSGERGKVLQSTARAVENGYPEEGLTLVIEKSLDSNVSGYALSGMIDTLETARNIGLPTSPFTDKIMEGLAKGIDEVRIQSALDRVGQRLKFAASQAERVDGSDDSSPVLIIRTSDAMAAGMDRKNLERIYDVMARGRVNRKIEPEEIMEMVKAASGYGVDPGSVSEHAISLMKSRKADLDDIRMYLEGLSGFTYRDGSGSDPDDTEEGNSHPDTDEDDEEDGDEDGDDDGDDGSSNDGDSEEDGDEEDDHEDDGEESGEEEEH